MAANSQELRRICEVPQLASDDVAPNRVKSKSLLTSRPWSNPRNVSPTPCRP